jgi:hypothetical protein
MRHYDECSRDGRDRSEATKHISNGISLSRPEVKKEVFFESVSW